MCEEAVLDKLNTNATIVTNVCLYINYTSTPFIILPVAIGRDEVQTTMDPVILYDFTSHFRLIVQILLIFGFNAIENWTPTNESIHVNHSIVLDK